MLPQENYLTYSEDVKPSRIILVHQLSSLDDADQPYPNDEPPDICSEANEIVGREMNAFHAYHLTVDALDATQGISLSDLFGR
jgi:hypothetical protein